LKDSNQEDLPNKLNALKKRIAELEYQLADEELQLEKSELMVQLLDSATDSVFLHDFDGNFVYVNEAAYKTRGYTKKELMGMNLHDLDVPKYEKLIKPRIKDLMEKGGSIFEAAHFRKDGSQMPVEIHSRIIEYKNKPLVLSYVRDITERKKVENDLISAREQYRTLFEDIGVGIAFISPKMQILDLNDQMKEWFPHIDVSKKPICYQAFNVPPREDICTYCPTFKTLEDGNVHESVTDTPMGDEIINYRIVSSPIKDEDGNVVAAIEMVEDITEGQKAAEKLKQSEEKFRAVTESAIDAIITVDSKGIITFFNHSLLELFGYSASELMGKPISILIPKKHKKGHLEGMKRIKSGEKHRTGRTTVADGLKKDGTEFPCEMSISDWKSGVETYFTSIIRDLTERQKVEEALRESEAEYRAIFENSKSAVAVYNVVDNGSNFIFKDFNKAAERIEKIKREDIIGSEVTEVFPGVVEFGLFEVFQRVWRTGKPEKLPVSIYQDERIWGWRENYVYKLPSGDVVAVYDDLTEIKQYEEELEKNQSRLKSLVLILQYKGESVKEFLDYALEEAIKLTESKLGYIAHYYEDKELFILNTWSREVMKDCSITPLPTVFKLEETGIWTEPVRQRKPIILNDFQAPNPLKRGYPEGHSAIYKYMTIPVFSGDKIVAVVAVANKAADYTETDVLQLQLLMDGVWKVVGKQKAEETIKENEKRLKILFEYAPDPYFISNFEGKILDGNKAVEGFIGYKKEGFLNKTVFELNLVNEKDSLRLANALAQFAQGKDLEPMEWRIRKKDGTIISAETTAFPIEIKGQKMVLIMGRDITERKKAENELKLSRMRLSNAMDLANLANWELDPWKQMFTFNDKFYAILGTTAETEGGYSMPVEYYIKEYVHPEDAQFIAKKMKKSLETREPPFGTEFEHRIVRRDGMTRYVAIQIRVIPTTESEGAYIYGTVQDITDRKITEEKLKESLEEKEMLLKEIHHRVKNNLMVISSLLNLQSQYIKDKESLDIFRESQNRAKSMALIHERLYRSTDLKKIDFGEYIHTLANDLFHTYVTDPSRIKLNMNLENVMVDINTTVPLGLILNELVTNSMKYAFPEGKEGEIDIEFHKQEDNFILIVSDTGVGFPEGLDFRNTDSLGLQLVNNLVSQIDGEITLDNNQGTEFKITFKDVEYK
jgi:PAS domain S-box-containing protein